ncbi:MAG: AsmA family protein [Pseudomonadota bacterium]
MIEVVSSTQAASYWTRKSPGKLAVAIAAAFLLAVAALLIVQRLLPGDLLSREVAAGLQRSTGLSAKIDGPTELRFFLRPRVIIQNLHMRDAAGTLRLDAARVDGYLRILPLLVGRFEIGQAVLYQPKFFADFDRAPLTRDGVVARAIEAPNANALPAETRLGMIDIVDGQGTLKTKKAAAPIALDGVNMRFDWPRLGASADFGGDLNFRGAPVHLQGWLEQPLEVLRGGESASAFQLRSALLTFWSSGRIAGGERLQYSGSITASAPSLRKLAETAGYAFSKRGTFADLDLTCDVNFDGNNAAFTNLALHLDGNDYQGNLEIQDLARTPHLSGTLASDFLDVTPFLNESHTPAATVGLWNGKPLDLRQLDLADLDLRVSAARLRLYDLEVQDAALSLLTKPGLIDLALAEATSNSGAIRGRFELTEKDKVFNLRVSGNGSGVNLQPMNFGGQHPLSGLLDASIELQSSGKDIDALTQGLSGQAALSAGNGAFAGIDLATTLAHGVSQKPGAKLATVAGTTSFDHFGLNLSIAHGIATINAGQLSAPNLQLGLGGTIDIGRKELDILSLAQITATAGKAPRTTAARFELKGPWSAPAFYQGSADLRLPKPAQPAKDRLPDTTPPPPSPEE